MGEETDIAEPMSSDDVKAAGGITANEPSSKQSRKRTKNLHKSIRRLLEFYLGDVNIAKNRFMYEKIQGMPFVYVDLSVFLSFNKIKSLTTNIEDLAKAVPMSKILQLSEDGIQVCRKTPICRKEDEEGCTIYVEQLGPDIDQDMLQKIFSQYGQVDYVSLPKFPHTNKNKGFAFVEFDTEQTATKALEAFNARGCCLSPHMAPEDLMSIKILDTNKENKTRREASESEDSKNEHTSDEKEPSLKRKRKSSGEEQGSSAKKIPKLDEEKNEKKGNKSRGSMKVAGAEDKETLNNKKEKRKRSLGDESEAKKNDSEPPPKKLKSDSEDVTESEMSHMEDDSALGETPKDSKKKRLRKKVKKDKSPSVSLGLKVLSKKEWKKLRNKYLNMQKNTMRSLKQQLAYSKRERNRLAPVERKKGLRQETPQSGTIIKVILEEPVTSIAAAKSDLRIHPEIKYIDVTESNPCVYLRTSTPEVASSLVQSKHWPNMEIIQGQEEAAYFDKMMADREENLKKSKPNQRGRSKLLKRAERFQGKHITTIEAS